MAFLVKLLNLTAEFALILFVFAAFSLMGIGAYGLMYEVTGNIATSFVGVLLLLTSPCLWSLHVDAGMQPRLMSLAFAPLSWLFLVRYAKRGTRRDLVITIVISAFSLSLHMINGLVTLASTIIISIFLMGRGVEKALTAAKILVASILLAPLPFLAMFYSPMPRLSLTTYSEPTVELLGLPSTRDLLYSSPVLGLSALLLLIVNRLSETKPRDGIEQGILTSLSALSALIVAFVSLGFFVHGGSYYLWLPIGPGEAIVFLPLCLSPLCAILLSRVYERVERKHIASTVLCSLIIVSFMLQVSIYAQPTSALNNFLTQHSNGGFREVYEQLAIPRDETMRRVGIYGEDGWLGQTFNYYTKTPQTRDYFSQGILYPDWLWWLYEGVWNRSDNYLEKNFLLDWFAVRWILVNEETSNPEVFLDRPQLYNFTAKATTTPIYEFEYRAAPKIVTAQTTPTMLVIGEYQNVFRGLSHSGFDSRSIVPIHGGEYIDEYTSEELAMYDSIFLYNYRYRDYEKAWNLLQEFVIKGGGLIVDTGVQYSGEWNTSSLPSIFPIDRTVWFKGTGSWDISSSENAFAVNFTSFSPATYDSNPWDISVSFNGSVRSWAEPILWSGGRPIVASGGYGAGRVVWLGMNLPWHLRVYGNVEESRFLSKIVDWTSNSSRGLETKFSAERVNPGRIVVRIDNSCEGVLLREFYFKDWHAHLEKDGKRIELKILKAGPDLMYVTIPKEVEYPISVIFEYDAFLEHVSMILSVLTMISLLAYMMIKRRKLWKGKSVKNLVDEDKVI